MSNSEETFVPYFKIRWSKKSTWTLEQAAYLSCGEDPDLKNEEISPNSTSLVSKRYYWHLNRLNKGDLTPTQNIDGIDHFYPGSFQRLWTKKKLPVDKEMKKVCDHMHQAPYGIDHTILISRAVYREAGRLIFKQFPKATREQVGEVLKDLPKFFNSKKHGHIQVLESDQIAQYLKELNDLTGKPKAEDKVSVVVDLAQLVEQL